MKTHPRAKAEINAKCRAIPRQRVIVQTYKAAKYSIVDDTVG